MPSLCCVVLMSSNADPNIPLLYLSMLFVRTSLMASPMLLGLSSSSQASAHRTQILFQLPSGIPWKRAPVQVPGRLQWQHSVDLSSSCRGVKIPQQCGSKNRSGGFAAQTTSQKEGVADGDAEVASQSLRELAESLVLPSSYLRKLPSDLRVDLKDAAFALASGPLNMECGEQVGQMLMQLSQAWEQGDTQAAAAVAALLPSLPGKLPKDPISQAALGKRFIRAGRHFTATGQYQGGELQKIGKALIAAGEAVSAGNLPTIEDTPITSARSFKFGDFQVEITSQRAYVGAGIALAFGLLSGRFALALQSTSEGSMNYANDNAFLLATSLRGHCWHWGLGAPFSLHSRWWALLCWAHSCLLSRSETPWYAGMSYCSINFSESTNLLAGFDN